MSLRLRLTLFIAAIAAVAIAVVAWAAYASAADESRAEVDEFLLTRAEFGEGFRDFGPESFPLLEGFIERPGGPGDFARFDSVVQVVATDGSVIGFTGDVTLPVDEAVLASARAGEAVLGDQYVAGTHYRAITFAGPEDTVFVIARDVSETDQILRDLRLRLLLVGGIGVLLAAVGAWFVARRALRPVGDLTATAEQIAETSDLDTPIEVSGSDEIGRLGAAFNRMLGALGASRRQQRHLVADAGHELRTPFTSLRTNIEVLARNPNMEPDDRAELMTDLETEVEELSALVNELIDLASQAEPPEEPLADVDLSEVARQAIERATRHTDRSYNLEARPSMVPGRPSRLGRAVANLLDNADKWSPPGATVDVVVDGGRVEVLDRGSGIPAEDRARVFDRFYRAPEARSRPGSGLGLAIVRQIVTDHGGTVFAVGREDGGSVVGFEIPTEQGGLP